MTSTFDPHVGPIISNSISNPIGAISDSTSDAITADPQPDMAIPHSTLGVSSDPLQVAQGVYVTIHGHFYQPPRENPYLDAIERQPSASPFHDWNERIHYECYRPNAYARVLSEQGSVVSVVNNYEYLSFNMGPTLMNWLERYDVETYQRILEADRKSCARLNGHGNAIAQVYNHIILPLANQRDKLTQIRWGKADFKSRFGRDPEGMWLAETAVDYPTLEALVAEGIRFIILAPSQAERCRPIATATQPDPQWHEVGGGQIDPTRPYRCFLPAGESSSNAQHCERDRSINRPFIDIFFYDGPISRDMGFDSALSNSHHFASRLGQAVRGDHRPAQLIAVATDGETFGHHKGGTEKCLAYAFTQEFPNQGWTVTNFAHYLSLNAPVWEVELKPVTAWSCSHGVDRWQENCGCGGEGGVWHQHWRRPLRDALDWLRDQLIKVYEEAGSKLFRDPWLARDEYIQVLRGGDESPLRGQRSSAHIQAFLTRHQRRKLTADDRGDALRLLEMQRHALLMYTSCGWFFEELSRPEGTQILRYAARALELAGDVTGVQLEAAFVRRLSQAPSNVDCFKTGAEVYRQLVKTAQISLDQVAAHYAISSLFTPYAKEQPVYCYTAHQLDYQLQRMGALTLAIGQLQLTSEITQESTHRVFAVLHLGGWDFHCCIQPFAGRRSYSTLKEQLSTAFSQASAAQTILAMQKGFGDQSFSLQSLFAEERHRIMRLLSQETLTRLDQLYTQVYRDNYSVLAAFHRDELPVPQELQVAAEVALSHRVLLSLRSLEQESSDLTREMGLAHLAELEALATEANHMRCQLKVPEAKQTLERLILQSLWHLLHTYDSATAPAQIDRITRLIALGDRMNFGLSLAPAQELYFQQLHGWIIPQCQQVMNSLNSPPSVRGEGLSAIDLRVLLQLGQRLSVDVSVWLHVLPC